MKNLIRVITFIACALVVLTSCKKDKYTEEDALKAVQQIELIIAALNASDDNTPLDSVIIKIIQNGVAVEKATDSTTGTVIFGDVKIGGELNVYASKSGYTSVVTTIDTDPINYRQSVIYANISMYSQTDVNVATINGTLTLESNLTNRQKEAAPAGTEVLVRYDSAVDAQQTSYLGTTDGSGNYSITVPVSSRGTDDLVVIFPDIVTNQTLALERINYSREIVSRKTAFYPGNYEPTPVAPIPSPIITIGGPTLSGTGFALTAVNDSATLSELTGGAGEFKILKKGSGYFNGQVDTIWLDFNAGVNFETARVQLRFEDGELSNILAIENMGPSGSEDAQYLEKPTISLENIGGGTGAIISYPGNFPYKVYISNNGSNYSKVPAIAYTYYTGGVKKTADLAAMGTNTQLSNGSIYTNNGDDLLTTLTGLDDVAPIFEIQASEMQYAQVDTTAIKGSVDTDSTFNGITLVANGKGYDETNPPTITVSSLIYGSGAIFRAEVNASGEVSAIKLVQKGSGYVKNVNDYRGDGTVDLDAGEPGSGQRDIKLYDVIPGSTRTNSVYYGTGVAQEEL